MGFKSSWNIISNNKACRFAFESVDSIVYCNNKDNKYDAERPGYSICAYQYCPIKSDCCGGCS